VLEEERYVEQLTRGYETTRESVQELADSLTEPQAPPEAHDEEHPLPHAADLAELSTAARYIHSTISRRLRELVDVIAEEWGRDEGLCCCTGEIRKAIAEHAAAYEAAKARSTTHAGKLKQIEELETRIKAIRQGMAETQEELRELGNPATEYGKLTADWKGSYADRADLLRAECAKLTKLSDGRIRATLAPAADTSRLRDKLSAELTGTRVRTAAIEALCKGIANSDDPVAEWTEIAGELESLAIIDADDDDDVAVPGCPHLVKAGVNQNDLERIARKLKPTTWLELSLTQLDDIPVFEYRRRER
jgi:hypothetical protein